MSTHISQIILNKIEKENIKPKAKWYFVAEHTALWIPGIVVTVLGAVAIAGMLYSAVHSGWEYREFVYPSQVDFFVKTVPLLWITSFIFFGSLITQALRTTHSGYRLSTKRILLGSMTTSVLLGVIFYSLDEVFEVNSVIRYQVQTREEEIVSSLEKGRLVGIVEKKYDNIITVRDKNNVLWSVDLSLLGSSTPLFIQEGRSINIVGTTTDENKEEQNNDEKSSEDKEKVFIACAVFPREPTTSSARTKLSPNNHTPKVHNQNNNPDCKLLLNEIKRNIRINSFQSERK